MTSQRGSWSRSFDAYQPFIFCVFGSINIPRQKGVCKDLTYFKSLMVWESAIRLGLGSSLPLSM
jgi:hypothetical protein